MNSEERLPEVVNADDLLRADGLDPQEWVLTDYRTWGSPEAMQHYVKAAPKKPEGLILPARLSGPQRKAQPVKKFKTKPRTVVFLSDQHAPEFDPVLHDLVLSWLETYKPDHVILGGDLVEFDTISRHRSVPDSDAVQRCIDTGYGLLLDYVQAAPKAAFDFLPGNHSIRLAHYTIDRARELYGIRKGVSIGEEATAALSLESLLRLDELGINYVNTGLDYSAGRLPITDDLVAMHGSTAKKGSGLSALKMLDNQAASLIIGHTHRQGQVTKTIYDAAGNRKQLYAVEAGCLAKLELADGYAPLADWAQGAAVATIYPDDSFELELIKYRDGSLYFRGERMSWS